MGAGVGITDVFVQSFEIKRVPEIGAVEEVVYTGKECVVDGISVIYAAVILYMKTERRDDRVLPEIEASCHLHVGAAWCFDIAFVITGIEIMVNEEEGVSPRVVVEAFECRGDMLAI